MDRITKARILMQLRDLIHYYNNSGIKVDRSLVNYLRCLTINTLSNDDLELINHFAELLDHKIPVYSL